MIGLISGKTIMKIQKNGKVRQEISGWKFTTSSNSVDIQIINQGDESNGRRNHEAKYLK